MKERATTEVESDDPSIPLDELTLTDILLLLESLEYSRLYIANGNAPYEVKQARLTHHDSVMAKLRALRDEMRANP